MTKHIKSNLSEVIMKFLKLHDGADIILTKHLAIKRFKLTDQEWEYYLAAYRFGSK